MQQRILVDNKWVTILEDKFQLPNGTDCTYYHAQKSNSVMAIAVDESDSGGYTFIVNQHRHPIGESIWQFPMGGIESSDEDPINAARNELREETGITAGTMTYLGAFYADPGFTNQKIHVCATNDIIEKGQQDLEQLEHGLTVKRISISDISSLIESGDMGDAWGLAGHYYLSKFLTRTDS